MAQKYRIREYLQTISQPVNLEKFDTPQTNPNLLCHHWPCWCETPAPAVTHSTAFPRFPSPWSRTTYSGPQIPLPKIASSLPFSSLLAYFAALHATVPRLFPANRLLLYGISMQPAWGGGGGAAEGRKKGRLGKQSLYSRLSSRARPSRTSGGELCNVTGRAHFPVQSCCTH